VLRAATFSCLLAGLLIAGVAGAANPASFSDPAGDAGSSPDIVRVDVSEYPTPFGSSDLDFWATLAGDQPCGEFGGVHMVVALDLDQNPDTGSAFYGTEVELEAGPDGVPILLRSDGWDFKIASPQPDSGFGAGCSPSGAGFDINRSELGLAPDAGFSVVVAAVSPHTDTAPDIGTFNYQPVPGVPPPTPGPDTRAPHIAGVFPAHAIHGTRARVAYWVLDGRGRTAETIRVYRRSRVIATIRRPLGETNPFELTHVSWRVPHKVRGTLRLSVVSVDAAGNRSNVRWGRLTVR
jgi:hypothetical protein